MDKIEYTGNITQSEFSATIFEFSSETCKELRTKDLGEICSYKNSDNTVWINITGLNETSLIEEICRNFNIGYLTVEDILHTNQRPKIESFDDYIYIVLKMVYYNENDQSNIAEQVSIILQQNVVITFQEQSGDVFDIVRKNIRNNVGIIRKKSADFLAYSLIDAIVDFYFEVLENIFEKIEDYEDELVKDPKKETLNNVFMLKKELIMLKKSVAPMNENFLEIKNLQTKFINKPTLVFFKDISDHIVKINDNIDTYREMLSALIDTYLSLQSVKMNEVMKLFTIVAAVFMPLTLLTGIYGMNFEYMPELKTKWGYPALIGLIIVIGVTTMLYLKKKKWI